jgi:hypothetical protein
MCLNPECRWITIIEDDKSGEKCYIHYKFAEDGTFEELFTEGDKGLKIYVEMMRDNKYFEPKDYPRVECPHFEINGTFDMRGHNGGHESHYAPYYPDPPKTECPHFEINGTFDVSQYAPYYPDPPNKIFNYPNQIAIDARHRFVLDCAGNILDMEQMHRPIVIDEIVDLDEYVDYSFELSQPSKMEDYIKQKNPAYKSSNGY